MANSAVSISAHLKHQLELLEAVNSIHRVQARHHRAIGFPVLSELLCIQHKQAHLLDQLTLEANLHMPHVVSLPEGCMMVPAIASKRCQPVIEHMIPLHTAAKPHMPWQRSSTLLCHA